jgi:DNA repair photolyase
MKEFGSFYKTTNHRKANTWCKYTQRLDSYGCGCQHDCSYCYAKSLLSFVNLWNPLNPSIAKIYKIKNRIMRLNRNEVIRLGGMTDCFQPIELKEMVTYHTILWLNSYKINYLIVTKSSIVSDDKYIKIYDKSLAHFQISITSTNDKKSLKFEKASLISERIKSIEKLYDLGFDVSVRLSPFIFQYVDFDILNSIRCNKILIEFLKVNHWIKKWFDIDYSEYSLKYGGYQNLNLERKIELVSKITGFEQVSVGEYVADHHEYFRDNLNYNKDDCCNLKLNISKKQIATQLNIF